MPVLFCCLINYDYCIKFTNYDEIRYTVVYLMIKRRKTVSDNLGCCFFGGTMERIIINRTLAESTFAAYTAAYNVADEKVKLKIDHTYRVAQLCERIARSQQMEDIDIELAWLIGLLHDVGRFEQLRQYGTFSDADSINHAQFGADILFKEGKICDYLPETKLVKVCNDDLNLIETAIRWHSAFRLPEDLDERTLLFCNIIRDADKIDIFKVNVDVPLEAIYNVTTLELKNCAVSEAVLDSFREEHATLRSLKQTPVDHVAGHISLVYELVFPLSVQVVREQGYLNGLLGFQSDCAETRAQFEWIQQKVDAYMKRRKQDS